MEETVAISVNLVLDKMKIEMKPRRLKLHLKMKLKENSLAFKEHNCHDFPLLCFSWSLSA